MKKTYIAPVTETYKANVQTILAASPAFKDGEAMSGDAKEWNVFDESEVSDSEDTLW